VVLLTQAMEKQKRRAVKAKSKSRKQQEHEKSKGGASRKRENLPHRSTLFIGIVKHTYCGTSTVQCAFIGYPIRQRPNGKKVKGQVGLE
jgi:hypothetical protein